MRIVLIVSMTVWLSACLGLKQPAVRIAYHTLEYPAPGTNDRPALPVTLKVIPFKAFPSIRTTQMLYRPAAYERKAFIYHRWQAAPSRMITEKLYRDLMHSNAFQSVLMAPSAIRATHLLEGTLEAFYARAAKDTWQAVLAVTITLTSSRTASVVLQQHFRVTAPCDANTPQAMARAMSMATQGLSADIITALQKRLQ